MTVPRKKNFVHNAGMSTGETQFRIRLPTQLKDALDAIAHEEGRSLNSEIRRRLESSLTAFSRSRSEEILRHMLELEVIISETHAKIRILAEELNKKAASEPEDDLIRPLLASKMVSLERDLERYFAERANRRAELEFSQKMEAKEADLRDRTSSTT